MSTPASQTSGQGIEAVLLSHRAQLVRFLAGHGAGEAAEDLFHELWMRVTERPTGPVANPLAYLYRAANNLMIDQHRSERQARRRESAWVETRAAGDGESSAEPSSDRLLIGREQLMLVEATLDALQPHPRVAAIFRLYRVEGMPQKAIAAQMGVSLSTVEADLRKAYAALLEIRESFDAA